MNRRGKGSTFEHDAIIAYQVFFNNGIQSIHGTTDSGKYYDEQYKDGFKKVSPLPNGLPSPEIQFMKKELFEKVSAEGKEVLDLIFNSPMEIFQTFQTKSYNRVSPTLIGKYLHERKQWPWRKINKCFEEMKKLIENLAQIQ